MLMVEAQSKKCKAREEGDSNHLARALLLRPISDKLHHLHYLDVEVILDVDAFLSSFVGQIYAISYFFENI